MRLRDRKLKLGGDEVGSDSEHLDLEMEDNDDRSSNDDHKVTHRGLDGDRYNVLLLLFLYILQGIPLGLAGSMPMVLQNKGISYKQQAVFSLVFWPFSLKLLWAPIVDSAYFKSFGRRKTWLVPTQYLIGVFMLILSLVGSSGMPDCRVWHFLPRSWVRQKGTS